MEMDMNIIWKKVEFKECVKERKPRTPTMSINGKSGRISLNAAACKLLPELFFYDSVAIVKGYSGDQPVAWGFQFIQAEHSPAGDFRIHKVTRDDKSVRCCVIGSKRLARMLVGNSDQKVVCPVTKINDFMLGIDTPSNSPAVETSA